MHNHFLWTVHSWRYARGTNEVRSEYRLGAAGYGQSADGVRTEYRRDTDGVRTVYGQGTDGVRMGHGSGTNGVRTRYGRSTDGVRTGYGRHTVVKKKKTPSRVSITWKGWSSATSVRKSEGDFNELLGACKFVRMRCRQDRW